MTRIKMDSRDFNFVIDSFEKAEAECRLKLEQARDNVATLEGEVSTWIKAKKLLQERLRYLVDNGIYTEVPDIDD